MTAALLSSFADDGKLSWDSPLRSLLPEFHRSDVYGDIRVADLLTHWTRLAALDSLWLAPDSVPFFNQSQAVQILNHAPVVRPFRANFLYNNFAYEVLGQVVEKLSGATFSEVLQELLRQSPTLPLRIGPSFRFRQC
jgi:CubicO group peptidase (beta-lactamase class C family)